MKEQLRLLFITRRGAVFEPSVWAYFLVQSALHTFRHVSADFLEHCSVQFSMQVFPEACEASPRIKHSSLPKQLSAVTPVMHSTKIAATPANITNDTCLLPIFRIFVIWKRMLKHWFIYTYIRSELRLRLEVGYKHLLVTINVFKSVFTSVRI